MTDVMLVAHVARVAEIQLWALNAPPTCAQNTLLLARLAADVHVLYTCALKP